MPFIQVLEWMSNLQGGAPHTQEAKSFISGLGIFRNYITVICPDYRKVTQIVGRLLHHLFTTRQQPDVCRRCAAQWHMPSNGRRTRSWGVRRKAAVVSYPDLILARLIRWWNSLTFDGGLVRETRNNGITWDWWMGIVFPDKIICNKRTLIEWKAQIMAYSDIQQLKCCRILSQQYWKSIDGYRWV